MKKYFLIAGLFLGCFLLSPKDIKAQIYNPYPAMIDTTLTNQVNTIMTRKAMQRKAAMNAKRRATKRKRTIHKKSRRVSVIENFNIPNYKIASGLPRRSEIA